MILLSLLLPDTVGIQAAEFRDNHASSTGGALSFMDSTPAGEIDLTDMVIDGNTATYGGGLFLESAASLILRPSGRGQPNVLRRNRAVAGGAMFFALRSLQKNSVQVCCQCACLCGVWTSLVCVICVIM